MRELEIKLDEQDEWIRPFVKGIYKGYAFAYINGKSDAVHRIIMGRKKGFEVDHKNRDKLDNRRENLQLITHQANLMNRRSWGSLPRGIYFDKTSKRKKPYKAMKTIDGIRINLGYFATVKDASTALAQ